MKTFFSPKNEKLCYLNANATMMGEYNDKLPDLDWIPFNWKMVGTKSSYGRCEGTITFSGIWEPLLIQKIDDVLSL